MVDHRLSKLHTIFYMFLLLQTIQRDMEKSLFVDYISQETIVVSSYVRMYDYVGAMIARAEASQN